MCCVTVEQWGLYVMWQWCIVCMWESQLCDLIHSFIHSYSFINVTCQNARTCITYSDIHALYKLKKLIDLCTLRIVNMLVQLNDKTRQSMWPCHSLSSSVVYSVSHQCLTVAHPGPVQLYFLIRSFTGWSNKEWVMLLLHYSQLSHNREPYSIATNLITANGRRYILMTWLKCFELILHC